MNASPAESASPSPGKPSTLSVFEKFGYASGDAAFVLYWHTWSQFLLIFYTDVFGISAASVGFMFAATRLFDAINDPLMGVVADQTRSRFGKFRPWLLWGILPYAVLGVMLFHVPDLSPQGKLFYAYATYIGVGVVYTITNIPYGALMGVMTPHSHERTALASFRFYGAYAAVLFVNLTLLKMVAYFGAGDDAIGYERTIMVYAAIASSLLAVVFFSTRERVLPPADQAVNIHADIRQLFRNGPWLVLAAVGLTSLVLSTLRNGATLYYLKYHLHAGDDVISAYLGSGTAALLVGVALTGLAERRLGGKQRAFILLTLVSAIIGSGFYFIGEDDLVALFVLQIVYQLLVGPLMPLYWSMIADTADYAEWKFGRRTTGLIFSAGTFSQKTGGALGGAIAGFYLSAIGYVANQEQTPQAIEGIKMMMSFVPLVVAALAIAVAFAYRITPEMARLIESELEQRKQAAEAAR